jgi:chitinase
VDAARLVLAAARPSPRAESGGQVSDGKNRLFHDPLAFASYAYDRTTFWSFDDATIIEIKASYIHGVGLRGAMLWSLDGDDGSLVRVLDKTLNEPPSN